MVVTVTLNPALDKTATLGRLVPGGLNRLENVTVDAGGKGVNVSRMITVLGKSSFATGFAGGAPGRQITDALDGLGIAHGFVRLGAPTRTNTKLVDAGGGLTELNEPGPAVTDADLDALLKLLLARARPGTLFVLSGSLPPGAPANTYRRFAAALRGAGATVFLDADGEALRQGLAAPPHYIKPNRHELLELLGMPANTPFSALPGLCRRLLGRGVEMVALSLGAQGALFATAGKTLYAPGLKVETRSTVGAGDSMVAALAMALDGGRPLEEAAALAMACAAGAATTAGTRPPEKALVESLLPQVELRDIP